MKNLGAQVERDVSIWNGHSRVLKSDLSAERACLVLRQAWNAKPVSLALDAARLGDDAARVADGREAVEVAERLR